MDSLETEAYRKGYRYIAGIDEAGRGPLAGPVVAAAVIFTTLPPPTLGIKDSKKLTPLKREALAREIRLRAYAVGIGVVSNVEIDRLNIHKATLKAMEKAVRGLVCADRKPVRPDLLLIDGPFTVDTLDMPQRAVVSGDSLSVSIAAASIIAKTTRDRIMQTCHNIYPEYNFMKNKGYGTREHISVLSSIGPSPLHRRSFCYGKR